MADVAIAKNEQFLLKQVLAFNRGSGIVSQLVVFYTQSAISIVMLS